MVSSSSPQSIASISSSRSLLDQGNALLSVFKGQNSILLLLVLAAWIVVAVLGGKSKKQKLATAQFAGSREKQAAKRWAVKQISTRKHNEVAFKIYDSVYLPFAQEGIAVCGGSGKGKTASMILPIAYSAIEQGFPLYVYDFKYAEPNDSLACTIAPMAIRAGYEVSVFAPGFAESAICNPLDFLIDDMDGLAARELASIMKYNLRESSRDGSDDPFFSIAGDLLIQAVILLAKQTQYPDMMMCQVILSLPNLPQRIQTSKLSYLSKSTFSQYLSVAGSEKTADSIRGTAQNLFAPFTTPGVADAFCGRSTLPLYLKGKQLVIIGMDKARRKALAPFLAGTMQMALNLNLGKAREDPFIFIYDEAPTVQIDIATALATQRSAGGIAIVGYQDIGQLETRYGKETARTILSNCATKAIFNPQEIESARAFSEYLGEEEIQRKQKSRGQSGGKGSSNVSDQDTTRKLFSPDRFLRMKPGTCMLINPGFQNKDEMSIPVMQRIKLTSEVRSLQSWCKAKWNEKVLPRLIEQSPQPKLSRGELRVYTETLLRERLAEAERILPMPDNADKAQKKGQQINPLAAVLQNEF
jgi:type IV secretory pathway TraG/TraD family ATPase VirD4